MSAPKRPSADPDIHPARVLDDIVHQRTRLGILTVLTEAGRCDFPYIKRVLELTDGNLGRHLEILAEHELVTITKGYEGKRPRTWAEITKLGSQALTAQVAAMRLILDRVDPDG
jgi:predicted transcriptional regulator